MRFLVRMQVARAPVQTPSRPISVDLSPPAPAGTREPLPSQERFWSQFRSAPLGVALLDTAGQIRVANHALSDLLGYSTDELAGMLLVDLSHPMDRKRDARTLAEMVVGGAGSVSVESRLLCKTGTLVWAKLSFHRMRAFRGEPEGILVVAEDLSGDWEGAEALHRLSTTDELTGLLNRRGFHLLAEQQWRIARRKGRELVLLYIDVDGLKQVNDQLGHSAGDDLLRETAEILQNLCRDTDVVARLGGDEFVILAVEATEESVTIFRERIRRVLSERNREPGRPYEISLSLGAAHFGPDEQLTLEELMHEADTRMYARKPGRTRLAKEAVGAVQSAPGATPADLQLQRLISALQEIIALALTEAPHAERLVRMHRRALAALSGTDGPSMHAPSRGLEACG